MKMSSRMNKSLEGLEATRPAGGVFDGVFGIYAIKLSGIASIIV